jgi:SAM-dependent methyltransferase
VTTQLHQRRLDAVLTIIRARRARSVLDLGCGDGDLLVRLLSEQCIERVVGVDVSDKKLERLRERLRALPVTLQARVQLLSDSMTNPRAELAGFDVAVLVESIEHLEPSLLSRLERAVFFEMRPATVVITTPNADFNPLLGIPKERRRRDDHCFEWGRAKFRSWAKGVAARNDYATHCSDIGAIDPAYGGVSQIGLFDRNGHPGDH